MTTETTETTDVTGATSVATFTDPDTPDIIQITDYAIADARRDARTPHARLLVNLLRQLQEVTDTLNELEDIGPDDCPLGLFSEEYSGPDYVWERILPAVRFTVEQAHMTLAMDLDGPGMRRAKEAYAKKHGVQVGIGRLDNRT